MLPVLILTCSPDHVLQYNLTNTLFITSIYINWLSLWQHKCAPKMQGKKNTIIVPENMALMDDIMHVGIPWSQRTCSPHPLHVHAYFAHCCVSALHVSTGKSQCIARIPRSQWCMAASWTFPIHVHCSSGSLERTTRNPCLKYSNASYQLQDLLLPDMKGMQSLWDSVRETKQYQMIA